MSIGPESKRRTIDGLNLQDVTGDAILAATTVPIVQITGDASAEDKARGCTPKVSEQATLVRFTPASGLRNGPDLNRRAPRSVNRRGGRSVDDYASGLALSNDTEQGRARL
jgi:hypothetical protein